MLMDNRPLASLAFRPILLICRRPLWEASLLAVSLLMGLTVQGLTWAKEPTRIQAVTVQAKPPVLTLRYVGEGKSWQPVLQQQQDSPYSTQIRLIFQGAQADGTLFAPKAQWLESLQDTYAGLYFLQTSQDKQGQVSLVLKSSTPIKASLCQAQANQISVCLSEGAPATTAPSPAARSTESSATTPPSPVSPLTTSGDRLEEAQAAFRRLDLPTAKTLLEQMFQQQVEPHREAHFLYAQTLIGLGRSQEALGPLSLIERLHPQAALLKAQLQLRQRQWDGALTTLVEGARQFGPSADNQYWQGVALEGKGDWPGAIRQFEQSVATDPDRVDGWLHLAQGLVAQRQWPEALAALQQVLLRRPDDGQALKLMAYVYQVRQQKTEALATYRQAVSPDLLYNYAVLAKQQGELEVSKTMALAARSVAGNNRALHYNLGLLLADLKEALAARKSLEIYLQLAKQAPADDAKRVQRAQQTLSSLK